MSAQAVGWVFEHSPYLYDQRIIHVAIADVVNDTYGNQLWMSVKDIARKARCSERTVQRCLARMVEDGYLELVEEAKQHAPRVYRMLMPRGDMVSPLGHSGVTSHPSGVTSAAVRGDICDAPIRNNPIEPKEPKRPSGRRKPQIPIPSPFILEEDHYAWAESKCPLVDADAETQNFVTWWKAKDGRFADWHQAWRNWMTKAQRRLAAGPQRRPA